MRAVIQRVTEAGVALTVRASVRSEHGLLVLLGVAQGDTEEDARWLASKCAGLRILEDAEGRMNDSVVESGGVVLLVSQFTLLADCRKGRRPSFTGAEDPGGGGGHVRPVRRAASCRGAHGRDRAVRCEDGRALVNDGPVTIILDSADRLKPRHGGDASMSCSLMDRLVTETPLILGSASPRRKRILEGLGLEFTVDVPDVRRVGSRRRDAGGARPTARVAQGRDGRSGGTRRAPSSPPTRSSCSTGSSWASPRDPEHAVEMLLSLRGRWHEVYTGVAAMRCSDGASAGGVEGTDVFIAYLVEDEIAAYVAGGEPLDKAGAYAIQDCGAALVEQVRGCFYNVVGLPVVRLCDVLKQLDCLNHKS